MRQSFNMRDKVAQHAFQIRQYVVVPIPNDSDAFFREPLRAAVIGLLAFLRVLSAIHFNGETNTRAVKVDGVGTDRMLLAEREAVELIAPQCVPQPEFGIGHVCAEGSCASGHVFCTGKA